MYPSEIKSQAQIYNDYFLQNNVALLSSSECLIKKCENLLEKEWNSLK